MKKLRDFIYDTNDIIIAILILVVAAGIIFWRMSAILDYPSKLLGTEDAKTEEPVVDDQTKPSDIVQEEPVTEEPVVQEQESEEPTHENAVFSEDGTLVETVIVDIEGNSAKEAVSCLVMKGLFENYQEYEDTCKSKSLDPEKIAAGRFTFKEGSTKGDICKQVNWG